MKRAAANEQVRNAARFERLDVAARHVLVVADEPAEQQTDMTSLNRHEVLGFAGLEAFRARDGRRVGWPEGQRYLGSRALGDAPAALVEQPVDVRADRVGQ